MGKAVFPRSLRAAGWHDGEPSADMTGAKVSAVASLIAVASFSSAEAQQAPLPSVTVEAPVARPKPQASRPTADQIRARDAMRRAARQQQQQQQAAAPKNSLPPDRNPYSSPASDYKGERLQASGKFPEKLLNTPKTVTVLSKEILADKNSTSLKSAVLSTAGVTLGTGEGGNAFGDRFFIRGFDARNDVFIDGVRDAGVSVRENFFTEQVEILRGPASSFAGRGTTGGAINIVTKQATTENSFYNMDTTLGTDQTKRVVIDVNQKVTPTFAARVGGLFQDAGVAGRDYVTDNRNGGFIATKWTPLDTVTLATNYIHTEVSGRPDFGVPYYRPNNLVAGAPFPEVGAPRNAWYGFVNRDFQRIGQDIGTINAEVKVTPDLTISDKIRVSRSVLNYIGTLPEGATITNPIENSVIRANPQSRFQQTDVLANQLDATYKFNTGPFRHTVVAGLEVSQEKALINSYTGLTSEQQGLAFSGSGSLSGVSVFNPQFTNLPFGIPSLSQFPTNLKIDTASVYALDSVNYRDLVILNGGVRYDKYDVRVDGFGTVNGIANTPGSTAASSGLPNFNLGLTLKPVPYASIYAAYATSSNPVGAEFDGLSAAYGGLTAVTNGGANQVFGPEKNTSIEIGTKWELLDGRLLVTGALFQTEKENARESFNVTSAKNATAACPYTATTGSVPCISAGAAYRIRGIDLQAGGKLTDKWSIFGGLVLMQSEVTKSNIPPANTALFTSNVGLQLANTAHQSFSLLTKYEINDTWEIGGQAVYRSKIYGGTWLAANQGTELPSYWRFDAFAEAKINKNWTAKLFVANIFDKLYYDAFYQSATPFTFVGPGRSASIVVSGRF
ncbi:TonB-dependent receptor [Bradyrhizobium sp. STM 3809]|uniref:TonB-dependent receptor n=1 Tax=Bradyrhizobium sp. STM 3809 TaxID=551936 RepID=UPI0002405ABC|nr:TonB-dependent receptor [Bradyrhizobium sp. STM 3809]CCD99351.1 putative TonB-dependent receptor protein [Bradyrhizobium sp. STM 3809]